MRHALLGALPPGGAGEGHAAGLPVSQRAAGHGLKRREAPRDEAYEAFAQAVYAAFGDRRKLHGGETVLAYEWVEQLEIGPPRWCSCSFST